MIPVCQVLAEAHKLGIIHRDIKPENIFLHNAPGGEIIKVLDFGIAKNFNNDSEIHVSNLTSEGLVLGTPTFMAPERLRNHPYDGRSDVYSIGVILYNMLSGECPFESIDKSITTVITMHLTYMPDPIQELNSNVPEELGEIIMRTLDKRPENRPTAQQLAEELNNILPLLPPDPKSTKPQRTIVPNQTSSFRNTITSKIVGED
jgi:serine/threonine protein kinase